VREVGGAKIRLTEQGNFPSSCQMDELPTFRNFLGAFWRNWLSLMSSGPSVPLMIASYYVESWVAKIALWLMAAGFVIWSAYLVWRPERTEVNELRKKLARISERRPLRFGGLSIDHFVQPAPPYGPTIIDQIGISFENTGDERLILAISELYFEYDGERTPIALPSGADQYNILAQTEVDYEFNVPDLQIQLRALQPVLVRFGFRASYDNVPPLKARGMEYTLDCYIRSIRPVNWSVVTARHSEY
jgi:hypothetical protein